MMDKIFKAGLLVLGVCFLILYYFGSQNNRYILKEGEAFISVFDTRTGIMYSTSPKVVGTTIVINPIEGTTEVKKK